MSAQDDYSKAVSFQYPRYIPVSIYALPATWMKHRQKLDEIARRHPVLFGDSPHQRDYDAVGGTYVAGEHVDEWGCVWSNLHTGMEAIVTHHPVPTRADVRRLGPPSQVTPEFKHGFMYLRLADLRGFEELMVDFAEEPPELQRLIDIVRDHNLQKLQKLLASRTPPGMLVFGDDLGMQTSLPMGPQKWRRYLKPCFMAMYQRCHAAGFDVYMHTDGHIWEIIPDLIECGVNVINPQIRANGLENLVKVCKGKICVQLDLDRQMFPFCTPQDIDAHVREVVQQLGAPEGGLCLTAELGPDIPLANIEAICVALEKYRGYWREA